MKQTDLKKILLATGLALSLAACASKPINTVQVDPNGDPAEEISLAEQELSELRSNDGMGAAQREIEKSEKALEKAKDMRAKNAKAEKINEQVALVRGWNKDAQVQIQRASPILGEILESRRFAEAAGAPTALPKRWKSAEKDLAKLSRDIQKSKEEKAIAKRADLNRAYLELEGDAVVEKNLGPIRRDLDLAKKNNADDKAPQSYKEAELAYTQAKKALEGSPRNQQVVLEATSQARRATDRLMTVTKQISGESKLSHEQAVLLEMERRQKYQEQIGSTQQELSSSEQSRLSAEQRAAALETTIAANAAALTAEQQRAQNLKERAENSPEAKAEKIRNLFGKNEAEVYTQGNDILIRMKGLSFAPNDSRLSSKQYPLMKKLTEAITEADAKGLTVEGHTDSTGSADLNKKLSQARAESVREYLKASEASPEKVDAVGYGYEKPLSSNKTAQGRAANRRIDVILTTE